MKMNKIVKQLFQFEFVHYIKYSTDLLLRDLKSYFFVELLLVNNPYFILIETKIQKHHHIFYILTTPYMQSA